MQIARIDHDGQKHWGQIAGSAVLPLDLSPTEVPTIASLVAAEQIGAELPIDDVVLLAPAPRPPQFLGVGLNYRDHAIESGMEIPTAPVTFGLLPSAIVAPGHPIELPPFSDEVDWEVELGIVIGREARNVSVSDALDYVLGYVVVNDVSARDVQLSEGQWTRAKSFDTFKPMGPWITTVDDVGAADDLAISLRVNGVTKQASHTSELIFPAPDLVSRLSQSLTLLPGAVITTGTPSGVGFAMDPAEYLQHGDQVVAEIERLGSIENPVVSAMVSRV